MRLRRGMAAVAAGEVLLAGCETGPSYDEVAQSFPPLRMDDLRYLLPTR